MDVKNMYNLEKMFKRQSKLIIFLFCMYAILAFVTPFHKQFTGLLFGTAGSLFSLWWMIRATLKFTSIKRTFNSLGILQRFGTVIALSLFALKYPSIVSIHFLLLGIVTMYVVIMVDYGVFLFSGYNIYGEARK